jgi:hypothetical protein
MAAGQSYLSGADVDDLSQVRRDMLATKIAMQDPAVLLTLARQNHIGIYVELSPVEVLLRIEDEGSGTTIASDTAVSGHISGYVEKEAPFDVQVRDTFKMTNGWSGHITSVPAEQSGIQRAYFTGTTGYAVGR